MASEAAARAGDEHARRALSIVRHCPFFPPNTATVTLSFAIGQGRMALFLLLGVRTAKVGRL
jgi:hypothetical protein